MKILNIGCGANKYKGLEVWDKVIGLDAQKFPDIDVVHDLNELPLPFKDNKFDAVYASHIIEYISDLKGLLKEIHRILKPDGMFEVIVPHRTHPSAYEIEHRTYWSMLSFDSLDSETCSINGFKLVSKKVKLLRPFGWFERIANRFPEFYEWRLSWLVPAKEIHFILKAIKKNER